MPIFKKLIYIRLVKKREIYLLKFCSFVFIKKKRYIVNNYDVDNDRDNISKKKSEIESNDNYPSKLFKLTVSEEISCDTAPISFAAFSSL